MTRRRRASAVKKQPFIYIDAFNATDSLQAHKQRTLALLNRRADVQLLDIGYGTSDDVRLLARQVGPTGKIVGIDPSATMITEARTQSAALSLPVEFHQGSVYELPFPDHTFPLLSVGESLER